MSDVDDANRLPGGAARGVLEYLTRSIVDDPDDVRIDVQSGRGLRLEVHVAPGDVGKVIGRRGRTAQALRTVTRAAAARDGGDVFVDIAD
jgi:predicted RNA-binding protein YlqC (UPF0109 family)